MFTSTSSILPISQPFIPIFLDFDMYIIYLHMADVYSKINFLVYINTIPA
jgi:hypothetical protein